MLKKLLDNKLRILLVLIVIFALACIRAFENQLFYDPFLDYFKTNFQLIDLPEINSFKLFLGLFFRYFLNSMLSLIIIYLIFEDLGIVKFSAIIYSVFFFILVISFFIALIYFGEANKMMLFYIRRFLIQPIFLLLFLPGFYLQKKHF